jgi:hypothetical protein
MRHRLCKLLSACLASLVLFSFVGCGDGKSPPRKADEPAKDPQKPGAR